MLRVRDTVALTTRSDQPAIVSAMTKALCYFNRHSPTPSSSADSGPSSSSAAVSHETRILVINATPGGPAVSSEPGGDDINGESGSAVNGSKGTPNAGGGAGGSMRGGYVGLMNCVFAAQKAKIPIDVLSLPPPSTGTAPPIFLQQASHLTEGVYWRWNGRGGLLQYLHVCRSLTHFYMLMSRSARSDADTSFQTIFLSPPSLRQTPFSIPPQDAVDFRAVCFCHQDVVDVGFVCSVCLSSAYQDPTTSEDFFHFLALASGAVSRSTQSQQLTRRQSSASHYPYARCASESRSFPQPLSLSPMSRICFSRPIFQS